MSLLTHHAQIAPDMYEELRHPTRHDEDDDDDLLFLDGSADSSDSSSSSSHAQTGVAGSVFSYVCTCVGAGVLSLPGALHHCGWLGLLVMALVAYGCAITSNYLIACMFAVPGKRLRSYEDIGEQALGPRGRSIVGMFQFITLFGVCTIFLIIIGGNMHTLVPQLTLHAWVFIFAAPLIPIAWLKTMNEVAYLAVFGVLTSLYVAGVVIVAGFMRASGPATIEYRVFDITGLSQAINIIVFSFGGHAVLPNIIGSLKRPKQNYKKVTGWSYFWIAIIYMLTAAGGYAGWGLDTKGKVLDNMSENVAVQLAYAAITAHVVFAYPIPLNPVSLQIERLLGIDRKVGAREVVARCVSRTALVLLTVFLASVIPYFADVLSLVSSLSIVVTSFIFPPLFYYLLFRARGFTRGEIAAMLFLAICGAASSVIGIYFSIQGLIESIRNNPNPFDDFL